MNNDEYIDFLKSVLVKIENALNLIEQKPSKHIPSYNKILGVQQKLAGLDEQRRNRLFSQLIHVRGIINYFMNGRYGEAHSQMLRLKSDLVIICLEIKNEKDTIKKI